MKRIAFALLKRALLIVIGAVMLSVLAGAALLLLLIAACAYLMGAREIAGSLAHYVNAARASRRIRRDEAHA